MVHAEDEQQNVGDKGSNDKAEVDHGIGGNNEVHLLSVLVDSLALGVLRGSNGSTGILSTDGNTQDEAVCRKGGKEATDRAASSPSSSDEHGPEREPD